MVKQISPAKPNINEYGSSLIPTLILSLKLYDLIYFITSFSYFSKANRTAFFNNYYFCYGNNFWMLGEIKAYALPDMPWHRPKPFFKIPYYQMCCKLFWRTCGIPILIASSGNIFANLANPVTMPGAPWQK